MKRLLFILLTSALLFFLAEGLCSVMYVAHAVLFSRPLPRQLHSKYDANLGWVSVPNYYSPNFYGPGIFLRTNAEGFRGRENVTASTPPGHLRVICSGDSFTFGYGVDDNHTWCHLLNTIDHRLETVNMGQPGYGIDQAYLWYRRDGAVLQHDVHVFGVITDDFRRMRIEMSSGYGKPVLHVKNDQLITTNIPVPQFSPVWRNLLGSAMTELRSVSLLTSIAHREFPVRPTLAGPTKLDRLLLSKMIADLTQVNKEKNSKLVVVYLPSKGEYHNTGATAPWRRLLKEEATQSGVIFIDLVAAFQELSPEKVDSMFICADSLEYFAAATGHLTDDGNAYVAQNIYRKLVSVPDITAKLNSLSDRGMAARAY